MIKGDFALRLRMTTEMTYDQIAKIAGYSDRISCYKGVQRATQEANVVPRLYSPSFT